jgi:hypothetical protein
MKRLLLLILFTAPLAAQTPPPISTAPLRPLVLSVREITDPKSGVVYDCPATNPECSVDILSSLTIEPILGNIPVTGGGTLVPLDPVDSQKRATVNAALLHLNRSIVLSRQLLELDAAGKTESDPDAKKVSDQYEAERRAMYAAITGYFRLDAANAGKTELELVRLSPSRAQTGQWLAARVSELNARSAARAATATSDLQVRMGAVRVRGSNAVPVHLPGYDTFDSRSPTDIQRITFTTSSAEQQQNAAEVAATVQIANLIRTNFKQLTDAYKQEIADAKAKLKSAESDLKGTATKSADLVVLLQGLSARLDATTVTDATLQAKIKKTSTDVGGLATTVQTTLNVVNATATTIASAPAALDSAAAGIDGSRPDLVLKNVLDLAGSVQTSVTTAGKGISDARNTLATQLAAIESDFQGITSSLPADAATLLARVRIDLLTALTGPIMQLDATKAVLSALSDARPPATAADAAAMLDLNAPQILTVTQPMPTLLEIARTDPAENDVIDVGLSVMRQTQVVYEEHRTIRVHFYGWHSGLASGLIFVRAQKAAQENVKPEAAAIWRIVRTPRPWETKWFYRLSPAIGFHSTTLHFASTPSTTTTGTSTNNDNGVQFGLGFSAHLWNDLLQVGYGWNIAVTKNRGYGYLGLGIMKLLRQAISNPGS